jgi:hypothetical protein
MSTFERVYLDTSVLRASNWPHVSQRLFHIEVYLPEPARRERARRWELEAIEAGKSVQQAWHQFGRKLDPIDLDVLPPKALSREELATAYAAAESDALQRTKILVSSPAEIRAAPLFEMALDMARPFSGRGEGFKDAFVLATVIEGLRADPATAAFVTDDSDFVGVEIEKYFGVPPATLEILTWSQATESLEETLKTIFGVWVEQDRKRARLALDQVSARLEEFLTARVSVTGIRDVTPPPSLPRQEGDSVAIVATVDVVIEAEIEEYQLFREEPKLHVGDSQTVSWAFSFDTTPQVATRAVQKAIYVEATANFIDGSYADVTFTGATPVPTVPLLPVSSMRFSPSPSG